MDPFRLCVALGPVAVYLLLLGTVNLFRRPFCVSGTRDTAVLGVAVSGLVLAGPVELLMPVAASIRFGPLVWPLLIALYFAVLSAVLLFLRPRLVIYNISREELRPVLADLAIDLDADSRWAGDCLVMPSLGVQLYLEYSSTFRNVSLVSAGGVQNYQGWKRLETALESSLRRLEVARNPKGISLLSAGVVLALILVLSIAANPEAAAKSLSDVMNL
ncbi:MAG: hypothetical protein ACYC6Y_20955 [Thermoguttaceae bacterium]